MINKVYTYGLLVLALLLSSCQAGETLRQAQDSFSQAATLEMQERFGGEEGLPNSFVTWDKLYRANSSSTPADTDATPAQYYQTALDALNKAIKGKGQLEKINAYDNALALKALTLWRTEQYDDAVNTSIEAVQLLEDNSSGEENDLRDLAMMRALPGLINMDRSYDAQTQIREWSTALAESTDRDEQLNLYQQIKDAYTTYVTSKADGATSVQRGLELIENAIGKIDGESAISSYLRNAQLAGLDNWGDILQDVFLSARRVNISPEDLQWASDEQATYNQNVRDYLTKLEAVVGSGKQDPLYKYWARLLAGNI